MNIVNSTVSGNSAEGGNFGNGGSALGGGIVYIGQGTLNLSNSTVAGNSAVRGYGYVGRPINAAPAFRGRLTTYPRRMRPVAMAPTSEPSN